MRRVDATDVIHLYTVRMSDRIQELSVFVRAAETGSFSKAAKDLSVSQSTITKQIAWLEGYLGARLLNRNTGSQSYPRRLDSLRSPARSSSIRSRMRIAAQKVSCGCTNCVVPVGTEQANPSRALEIGSLRWPLNVKTCCWQQRNVGGLCGNEPVRVSGNRKKVAAV